MCTNPIKIIVNNEEVTVKCGKCDTCRKEKASDWAIKLINEKQYHKKACFITLTFDNKILLDKNSKAVKKFGAHPGFVFNITESKEYFTKFIKRLRKHFKNNYISYYKVGEYGDKTKRPHYHAIIYGINFDEDRKEGPTSKSGHIQYISKTLNELWAVGNCTVQDCNENNIIYIAQYCLKKFKKDDKYKTIFSFSNRSKISVRWVRRYYKNIEKGYLETNDGKKFRIPESYKKNLQKSNREKHKMAFLKYEQNIMERISNTSNNEIIEKQKIKEEIWRLRAKNKKSRDF